MLSYSPQDEIAGLPLKEGGSRIGVRDDEEGLVPSKISIAREVIFLRALAHTGNATLAAVEAGVSRDWAYKKRMQDARFDGLCREMVERFRTSEPPHPPAAGATGPSLSREGRGNKRVQVRRDRYGGWTAAKEARFIERLRETCSVWLASAAVGLSTVSAYRRRQRRSLGGSFHPSQPTGRFADAWDEAIAEGWPPADQPWIESAICFFEGRPPPPGNPVRITGIDDVLDAMKGKRFAPRRQRARRS